MTAFEFVIPLFGLLVGLSFAEMPRRLGGYPPGGGSAMRCSSRC